MCRHRVHQLSHTHLKEFRGFFSRGGCSRRPDRDKLLLNSLPIPNQHSRNTSYPQRAARWRHTVGARAILPYLRTTKRHEKLLQLHSSYCSCVGAGDAKMMQNKFKKNGTNQKQAKKDAEEHVTRSMPDTLF